MRTNDTKLEKGGTLSRIIGRALLVVQETRPVTGGTSLRNTTVKSGEPLPDPVCYELTGFLP